MSSPFARRAPRTANPRRPAAPRAAADPARPAAPAAPVRPGPGRRMPPEVLWTVPETGHAVVRRARPARAASCGRSPPTASPSRSPSRPRRCPTTLAGRDLLGRGQTGSGKTLAFGLAMLARLARRPGAGPAVPEGWSWYPPASSPQQVIDALQPFAKALGPVRHRGRGRHVLQPPGQPSCSGASTCWSPPPAASPTTPTSAPATSSDVDRHGDRRGRPDGRHGLPAAGPRASST